MFQCHYKVLSVTQDADSATIKKAHRKLAIQWHPDKNLGNEEAAEKFRVVQEAYECLSDVGERKWYDEHRDALLKGWSPSAGGGGAGDAPDDMLFDVIPFMHAHCYSGYKDGGDDQSFYTIYAHVFSSLAKEEADAVEGSSKKNEHELPFGFGDSNTDPREVAKFYAMWEGFVSQQTFSWADQYDVKEAESRRIRRAMEDENKKKRKIARKARNEDVVALVRFCKRRDPRIEALKAQQEQEKAAKEKQQVENKRLKKQETQEAREKWRQQAEEDMAQAEEIDRLAGRVRLADLEDDYDYGGGKKKGKKGKKGKKNKQNQQQEEEEEEEVVALNQDDGVQDSGEATKETGESEATEAAEGTENEPADNLDNGEQDPTSLEEEGEEEAEEPIVEAAYSDEEEQSEESSEEEEEEPDFWRCECCRKDFKSQGQMDNHMKSKKHKEANKKYHEKMEKEIMMA